MYKNKYTFSKKERLCSRKVISQLFENGNSFYSEPFRVLWLKSDNILPYPAQTAISVGKKSFAGAVERNRLKRLIREAWRLNKHKLYKQLEKLNMQIAVMIIYSGNKIPEYLELEAQMEELISKFSLHLSRSPENIKL
ncbi:MAG: ribonuclease P protein component [Bacteroidota bacterium]|nr:ribonuclease P protein component [Bacteroidota bacterium]